MQDTCTYLIQLGSQVNEDEINTRGPLQVSADQDNPDMTRLTVCTDQSGLIGLLRYLHGLGFVFLALSRASASEQALPTVEKDSSTEGKAGASRTARST